MFNGAEAIAASVRPGPGAEHPSLHAAGDPRHRSETELPRAGWRITLCGDAGCRVVLFLSAALANQRSPTHAGPSRVPGPPLNRRDMHPRRRVPA